MSDDTLLEELAAARRTIAVLSDRVEAQLAEDRSSFGTFARHVELQRIVANKTAELERQHAALEKSHAELHAAHAELARTQSELAQAQKMESVGRLASGIAHEINTPSQFVSDSLQFTRDSFADVLPLLRSYGALVAAVERGEPATELAKEVRRAEEVADLAYMLEHVPEAFDRAVDGLGRITRLVRAMKDFAHPEQPEKSQADLNRALASTLIVARGEYKLVADVEEAYGELPLVNCHLGELNQVFLNLIVNAAHAIAERVGASGERGHLRVETAQEGERVRISISDDGCGIPPAIAGRIFEPFFTTKGVGKGTGQGLAIARSVVVGKHGGELTFEARPGSGTTFHLRLPIAG